MESKGARKRWTYQEFARLPISGTTRYEVIDDELVVTPSPSARHQEAVTNLVTELNRFARTHGFGKVYTAPLDVLFTEGDYVEPDILFVRSDHLDLVTERGVEGPPDLVVEVLSSSTAARDRGVKLERYRLYGVPEYWVVDPDEQMIEVWKLAEGAGKPDVHVRGETVAWTPLPDGPTLSIRLDELFEGSG